MHFHLPKPMHGWRAFAGEVGIIVVGVLIALSAEQLIDRWHWNQKVTSATKSIDFELNDQLDYAEEVVRFDACSGPFVDALEQAILRRDSRAIATLHDVRPPFEPRPWRSTAWQSAMSTQVADHLESTELAEYAFMFNSFEDMRRNQEAIITDFAEATTGRLGGPTDPTSTHLELAAAERLRTELALQASIAETMVDTAAGLTERHWKPIRRVRWQRLSRKVAEEGALCERTVGAVRNGSGQG